MATLVGDWGGGSVWRMTSGVFPSNAYFCEADMAGGGILIDLGLDGEAIDAQMVEHGLRPHHVLCPHGHFDHAGSASYFQNKYNCQVFMHEADACRLKTSNFFLMALKISKKIELPEVAYINDRFSMEIDGHVLRFLFTPGHTPGSCVIELGRAWFTSDTIYSHGVGLSKLPGENTELLKASIRGLWECLTIERNIYPDHGMATNGASVRSENRTLSEFLGLFETSGKTQ